ncbi:MAG: hypothetical protein E7262_02580 [Lachnospiraceae bacterium]|nr:hypothetical protein [Lachnospiraceae bacterium]
MDYEALNKAIKQMPIIVNKVNKAIKNIVKEIPSIIERTEESIRTMDDDKFEKYLNKLDDIRLKEKAIAIKNGEKVNWF